MRVGIIQPSYIPWRGYFDFIEKVDLFIFFDDVQYTTRDWRNRNRIKTASGLKWLTVPVKRGPRARLINETPIDYSRSWEEEHLERFAAGYAEAPYFRDAVDLLACGLSPGADTISDLDIGLTRRICRYLNIATPFALSSQYSVGGTATERLAGICAEVGATTYLSGPRARRYLDHSLFRARGIRVEYKTYDYPSYPQLWGDFAGQVSVLDLIANVGPEAGSYLKGRTPGGEEASQ